MFLELTCPTPEATKAVGHALSEYLKAGDVLLLTGDLGAGKTTLTQGIASGLDVDDAVVSPTFTLIREYEGRIPVAHVDVYRLEKLQDVMDLGFDEILADGALLIIEWGDAIEELFPDENLTVELTTPVADSDERVVILTGSGSSWVERWPDIKGSLSQWSGSR